MPSYLCQAAYTSEAWSSLQKNPEDRIEAIRPIVARLGGRILSGFISFGDYDVVLILEMPDNTTAAAFSMAASGGGALRSLKTTPLLTTQEARQAMEKAAASGYEPPAALFDTATDLSTGIGIE